MKHYTVLKMSNGQDVVGLEPSEEHLHTLNLQGDFALLCPGVLIMQHGQNQAQMSMIPWCPDQKELSQPVVINADHVVAEWEAGKQLAELWEKFHMNVRAARSGIAAPGGMRGAAHA